jgi:GAF domain-containing protein
MTSLTVQETVTIILITLGAGVMVFSAINTRQILNLNQEKKFIRSWQILFALIILFLLGYIATNILITLKFSYYLVVAAGVIFFLGALFVYLVSQVSSSTIKENILLAGALQEERSKINQQSIDLEHRFKRLSSAVQIARHISGFKTSQALLQETVEPILREFNLYYAGIFIIDETGQLAILRAATGEAGKAMLAENYRLTISDTSMVGWSITHRQARIAQDVGKDTVRFVNPHLPNTHSELALPLIFGDQIIGALTIQSEQPAAFNEDDIINLQTISDTLAIALENARLFQETQSALEELRMADRSNVARLWSGTSYENEKYEYETSSEAHANGTGLSALDVPLILREQIIGQLHLEGQQDWTAEERNLVEAIATQAALAMENARLLEESQEMALRERLAAEITSKVWSSSNTDLILQTAVKELGRALRADEATIELKME